MATTSELDAQLEQIVQGAERITELWGKVPKASKRHYFLELIAADVQASNELEGIDFSVDEIDQAIDVVQGHDIVPHKYIPEVQEPPLTASYLECRFEPRIQQYLALPGVRLDWHSWRTDEEKDERKALEEQWTLLFPRDVEELRQLYDMLLGKEIAPADAPDGMFFRASSIMPDDSQSNANLGAQTESEIIRRLDIMIADGWGNGNRIPEPESTPIETADLELVKIFAEHLMFEHTLPFYVGNGRMGRFLMCLRLAGVVGAPAALAFSAELLKQKKRYEEALAEAMDPLNYGELTFYLQDMADIFASAQQRLEEQLRHRTDQLSKFDERMDDIARGDTDVGQLHYRSVLLLAYFGWATIFGGKGHLHEEAFPPSQRNSRKGQRSSQGPRFNAIRGLDEAELVEIISLVPTHIRLTKLGYEFLGLEPDSSEPE